MITRTYTTESAFHWMSDLRKYRKIELIEWVNALSEAHANNLEDLLRDARENAEFDYSERDAGADA